jgi:hypothetical protein
MGHAEHLREAVVHLAGDPFTFGEDCALPSALAHPDARDGDRGEPGERHEKCPLAFGEGGI